MSSQRPALGASSADNWLPRSIGMDSSMGACSMKNAAATFPRTRTSSNCRSALWCGPLLGADTSVVPPFYLRSTSVVRPLRERRYIGGTTEVERRYYGGISVAHRHASLLEGGGNVGDGRRKTVDFPGLRCTKADRVLFSPTR
jgi:hypothetical protein